MSRLFHARIRWQSWLYLVLILFVAVYAGWHRMPVVMTLAFLGLILVIERIVHTSYRITDTRLVVHTTRFRPDTVVPLASVVRIDRVRGLRLFGRDLNPALLVVYRVETDTEGKTRELAVVPQNETDFVDFFTRKRQRLERPEMDGEEDDDEDLF